MTPGPDGSEERDGLRSGANRVDSFFADGFLAGDQGLAAKDSSRHSRVTGPI